MSRRGEGERLIRVCHVQVLPLMTGVQRAMLQIFEQLDRRRFEPWVVCRDEGPLTDELAQLGIGFTTVPSLDRPIRPGKDLRAYFELKRLFEREQFDIVHTHSSKPGALGRIAARLGNVPHVVHHVQGFAFHEFSPPAKRWLYSSVEKFAGRYCDRVIFANDEERQLAIRSKWLPAEKCLTIHNGVDLSKFPLKQRDELREKFRAEHRLAKEKLLILVSGRLEEQKQPLILPEIAAKLATLRPHVRWRFAVVGTGSLHEKLADRIDKLGLRDRIQLFGWQNDPRPATMAADIALHTSLWEGMPLSLLDAQAAGLPSVASNVKGNREIVTPETGFLCAPKDADAYLEPLVRLIDDTALRAQFGTAARIRAEKHFDAAVNARQVVSLYEELLAGDSNTTFQLRQLRRESKAA